MRAGAGIDGWNGSRKPWNLGSLLISEKISKKEIISLLHSSWLS